MSSFAARREALAVDVRVTEDEITLLLADGRRVSAPLVWFPRLLEASAAARSNWRLVGDGEGVHWPDADEDVSVEALLLGVPSVDFSHQPKRGA